VSEPLRDSVELYAIEGDDPNVHIGTIKLVDGRIVAEGTERAKRIAGEKVGDWSSRNHVLVGREAGREFLVALVEQYGHCTALRAAWTDGEVAGLVLYCAITVTYRPPVMPHGPAPWLRALPEGQPDPPE
jgi:hypothetical protein